MVRALSRPADALLFVRVFFVAAAVPLLLRLRLPAVTALLGRVEVATVSDPLAISRIRRCVRLAIRRGRPFIRPGCLTRGVTLYYFLRRAGVDVSLCFGMGRPEGEFAGHCWLVKDGAPFLESRDPRPTFPEVFRIPGSTALVGARSPLTRPPREAGSELSRAR